MSPRERRRKGKYQAPTKKNKRRQERSAPQPNVVVASQPAEAEAPAVKAAAAKASPATPIAPAITASPVLDAGGSLIKSDLKRVAVLGAGILAMLVLLAFILGS